MSLRWDIISMKSSRPGDRAPIRDDDSSIVSDGWPPGWLSPVVTIRSPEDAPGVEIEEDKESEEDVENDAMSVNQSNTRLARWNHLSVPPRGSNNPPRRIPPSLKIGLGSSFANEMQNEISSLDTTAVATDQGSFASSTTLVPEPEPFGSSTGAAIFNDEDSEAFDQMLHSVEDGRVRMRDGRAVPSLRVIIPPSTSKPVKFLGYVTPEATLRLLNGSPFAASNSSVYTASTLYTPDRGDKIDLGTVHMGQCQILARNPSVPTPTFKTLTSPIPHFPYRRLETVCRALDCPVRGHHEMGPYLHKGRLRQRIGNAFGASNPPPEVWDAHDRLQYGISGDKYGDTQLVTAFVKYHYAYREDGRDAVWGVSTWGSPEPQALPIPGVPRHVGFIGRALRAWRVLTGRQ